MEDIIYKLVVEDVQNVAEQEIGRELQPNEIEELIDSIAEKIQWYDAISLAIKEKIKK